MAINRRQRWQVFRRDDFACGYCGLTAQDGAVLEVDHIHPRARGGSDDPSNLITACSDCNSGKSDAPLRVREDLPKLDLRQVLQDSAGDSDDAGTVTANQAAAIEAERWEMVRSRWLAGFDEHPGSVALGKFAIARAQAEAVGVDDEFQCRAAQEAGKAKSTNLLDFLDPDPELDASKRQELLETRLFLDQFIAAEIVPAMHRALAENGGEWFESFTDALIGAANELRRHVEEYGRDCDLLERWLDGLLPRGTGSKYLVMATAEWDKAWRGRAGHAALECRNEVLEHAVALALMEVSTR